MSNFEKLSVLVDRYQSMHRALICLENNPNVDVIALSMRLHNLHKGIIAKLQEVVTQEFWIPLSSKDATFVVSLLLQGYTLEKDLCNIIIRNLEGFYVGHIGFDEDSFSEEECAYTKLELHTSFCKTLFFQWDEESETGYLGEEPEIGNYEDPKFEAYLRSLGLTPEYRVFNTYHSREICLLGIRK